VHPRYPLTGSLRLSVGGAASLPIDAIHHHVIETDTITFGYGLHGNKAVPLEKALRKLCRIRAQHSGCGTLGGDMIDPVLKQRAADAVPMLIGRHYTPAERRDAYLWMIKCNSAAGHNPSIMHDHPETSDLTI
jgi:hypothetical protein